LIESASPTVPSESEEPETASGIPGYPFVSISIGLGAALLFMNRKRFFKSR
jgi:hypothetical protein